ncbi:hypothetical protein PsYK624_014620 [Phanerochaete sordida]|uniref:Uncharacterized protein n=1 Tax=Phanerochaete sordida TaxID=48140 RepID=A0A9P3FY66_9APHY|nr:hypothetical protein PsYK624_014620 [Phanerochaete sordida]
MTAKPPPPSVWAPMPKIMEDFRGLSTSEGQRPFQGCNIYVEPLKDGDQPDKEVLSLLEEKRSIQSVFKELITLRDRELQLEALTHAMRRQIERLHYENGRYKAKSTGLDGWRLRLLTELEREKYRLSSNGKSAQKNGKLEPTLMAARGSATPDLSSVKEIKRLPLQSAQSSAATGSAAKPAESTPAQPTGLQDIDRGVMTRILYYVTPPHRLLPYSLTYGPQSPWCAAMRTLKTVAYVSKAWHEAAMLRLYVDVVLRRPGQIIALSRTVRSSPHRFGVIVRNITLCCDVPDSMLRIVRDSLVDLIDYCPYLVGLSFQGAFPVCPILGPGSIPSLFTSFGGDGSYTNLPLPQRILHLGIYNDDYPSQFKPGFLALLDTELPLRTVLSFAIYAGSSSANVEVFPLPFNRLETLTLWSSHSDPYFHIPHWWNMPKLKAIRFRPELTFTKEVEANLTSLFKQHGSKFLNVDFGANLDWPVDNAKFEAQLRVLELCPNLEFLAIRVASPEQAKLLRKSPIFSRSIDHVDLIVKGSLRPAPAVTKSFKYHEGSRWKHVRYVDIYLLRWAPELSYIFSPQHNLPRDFIHIHNYYGLTIKDGPSELALYHSPLYGEDESTSKDDGGSDADSDYCPSSSESSSYDSSDISDLEPDELQDHRTLPSYGRLDTQQITENEALAIYFSTLEHVEAHLS